MQPPCNRHATDVQTPWNRHGTAALAPQLLPQMHVLHIAPPLATFLAKHPAVGDSLPLPRLRDIICAAAPLGSELAKEVKARLGGSVSVRIADGLAVTWRLHGGYMAVTWRSHGGHMAVTWRCAWRLHGGYMAVRIAGDMAVTWRCA